MSEFQNIKELAKTFPEQPEELRRCGSTWGTVCSDQRLPSDPMQSFENKTKSPSAQGTLREQFIGKNRKSLLCQTNLTSSVL